MAMDVGQSFLQYAEEREFDCIGQTDWIVWGVQGQFDSTPKTKALDIPSGRRSYPHRVHGRRMQQIGKGPNLGDASLRQLFGLGPQLPALRRRFEHVHVEFQSNQVLPQTIVQLTGNAATLRVLQAQQPRSEER